MNKRQKKKCYNMYMAIVFKRIRRAQQRATSKNLWKPPLFKKEAPSLD